MSPTTPAMCQPNDQAGAHIASPATVAAATSLARGLDAVAFGTRDTQHSISRKYARAAHNTGRNATATKTNVSQLACAKNSMLKPAPCTRKEIANKTLAKAIRRLKMQAPTRLAAPPRRTNATVAAAMRTPDANHSTLRDPPLQATAGGSKCKMRRSTGANRVRMDYSGAGRRSEAFPAARGLALAPIGRYCSAKTPLPSVFRQHLAAAGALADRVGSGGREGRIADQRLDIHPRRNPSIQLNIAPRMISTRCGTTRTRPGAAIKMPTYHGQPKTSTTAKKTPTVIGNTTRRTSAKTKAPNEAHGPR